MFYFAAASASVLLTFVFDRLDCEWKQDVAGTKVTLLQCCGRCFGSR